MTKLSHIYIRTMSSDLMKQNIYCRESLIIDKCVSCYPLPEIVFQWRTTNL